MLTAHYLSKSYNLNSILVDVSFSLNPGDRVGLIGPNGCGKTTLLRILAGQELPDRGTVTRSPAGLQVGYLPQGFEFDPHKTLDQVLQGGLGDPEELGAELSRLATELAAHPEGEGLQAAYDGALQRMERFDPALAGQAHAILGYLGLSEIPGDLPVDRLSGGQKTRLSLALLLLSNPQLLLLDEPTNHLDVGMLEWLEGWLSRTYIGAALVVSHDRAFLDHTVRRILDLNPETHTLREYAGNYSDYLEQYLSERERLASAYKDQVAEIRKMRQDIALTKQQARWVEVTTTSRQPGVRRYAKKVAKKALSREKKLERYLESDDRLEKPKEGWQMKLDFSELPGNGTASRLGQDVLFLEDLSVGYAGHAPLLSGLDLHLRSGRRVVLTGPNGMGKTTLLRTIAGLIPPLSGQVRLGASVRLGYMPQEQELLAPEMSALEIIQSAASLNETEARSFLHYFLFSGDDPLRPSSQLSFGERARLLLAQLVARGCNFLLLDEPINHLDIPSRQRFEQALAQFDGTVLAVVHDRYFIGRFATDLWIVEEGQVRRAM
jgi:ATP-binding cassette subfamily F protein 3